MFLTPYSCVGRLCYTEADPHQGIPTLAWDRFSLAAILYRLLFGGHPFAASALMPFIKQNVPNYKL